jgi:urea transport system ATP-binding protein
MSAAASEPEIEVDVEELNAVLKPADVSHDYLEIRGLRVTFGGFVAVDGIDMTVVQGDLRFLIGPNGAGKTTVVDALTGLVPATGEAKFGGLQLVGNKVDRIARAGVGRTFQTASVIEQLTVLENLDLAAGATRGPLTLLRARRGLPEKVALALDGIGLGDLRDRPAGILAHGQKQWLEIGMLLVQDARLLLLDEPVAGMNAEERQQTGELLKRIGDLRTVVVVEHDMEFLRSYADSVTVLHRGRVLAEGTVAEVQANQAVVEVYLGHAPTADESPEPDKSEELHRSEELANHAEEASRA